MLDNHQVQITCAKNPGINLGDQLRFMIVS